MPESSDKPVVKSTVEARQAGPGYNIYVLALSLGSVVVLMAIVYFYVFG